MKHKFLLTAFGATMAFAYTGSALAATEIQWWHAMGGKLGEKVVEIAEGFNASQSDYKVTPVYKGNYTEPMTAAIAQGHSKKAIYGDGLYGGASVFAEDFARLGNGYAGSANECDGEVSERGERPCGGAGSASVLVEGDIADIVEAVFDRPVGACEGHEALGSSLSGRQACDEVGDLDTLASADFPSPLKPGNLRQTRPVEVIDGFAGERDAPGLDPPVALLDRLCLTQVRRRPVRGGKRRRRRLRCRA